MTDAPCIFCEIVADRAPAKHFGSWISSIVIEPLNPVTPGHLLVIPRRHVEDATEDPTITATTAHDAAMVVRYARVHDPRYDSANIITSIGTAATQTVRHLHLHVVPRVQGDGLLLPWSTK